MSDTNTTPINGAVLPVFSNGLTQITHLSSVEDCEGYKHITVVCADNTVWHKGFKYVADAHKNKWIQIG